MHNLKPNTAYNLVRVDLAIDASTDEDEVLDGLNETLRQACYDEAGGICDWQYPGLITGDRTLHYRTVTTGAAPEECEIFSPEIKYRVWVLQSGIGNRALPSGLPVLANTSCLVSIQQQETDQFLFVNVHNRQEGELRTDVIVTRRAWTQSEACVLRLLRRVREGRIKPESLHLYFHDHDGKYDRIPVTEDGDLRWHPPLGFFDWRDSELF